MKPELDRQLVKEHPTLFADRHADMRTTAMYWGFECGDGWYELLKDACDKIEPILAANKKADPLGWKCGLYRASQVKEKYGTLRLYLSGASNEVYKIVDELEHKSSTICEECGKPGKIIGGNWLYCRCRDCYEILINEGYTLDEYDRREGYE